MDRHSGRQCAALGLPLIGLTAYRASRRGSGFDIDKPHFISSRDIARVQLPNSRHERLNIAGALAKMWAFLLGLRA